ncbi:hypothetical protein MAP00_007424 [Monascus purpureus]|nr:hypothetical protein MAP00_007424 [Monascus purpureus]
MYIAENTPAKIRGRMVLLGGFFAIGGIVLASWLEFGLWCVENNSVSWRFPIAFQAIFALAITSLILFIPESPRWLVQRSRNEEAARVLAQLEDVDGDDFRVAVGFNTIRHSLQQEDEAGESGNPFARNETRNLHRTCLAVGVNLLAQMSGVNIITFYGCVGYCEGEDRGAC